MWRLSVNVKNHKASTTPWLIKRRQLTFVWNFVKNQRMLIHVIVDLKMNGAWYELDSPHLNLIMLLHYLVKVKNTENVVLHRHITKENCIICIIASSEWTIFVMCLKFTYMGVLYSNAYMKRFMTSTTCKNAWCKLGLTLTRISSTLRLTSGVTIWYHVCVLVDSLNTCSDMTVHFCHWPEHWNCQCYLTHV